MTDIRKYILDLSIPDKISLLKELYSDLSGYGTDGDTELAHINVFEASVLKSLGGSGTINDITGLVEYKGGAPAPPATQTVTQATEFPPELKPFITDVLGEARTEFQREKAEGFQPFPGPQIASFTPEQQAAFEAGRQQFTGLAGTPLGAAETYARPALAATALGTSEIGAEDIQRRMDPFLQNVVDIAKREAIRDEESAVQARAAQAVGAGSFGGTRQALVESEAERNLAERLGDIQARGLSTSFQNAQLAAEQQRQRELGGGRQFATLGDITGQRARADIAGLAGIGETQQQRDQQALDIARQEFAQEQQFPAQTLGKYQALIRGFPYQMGGTTVQKSTVPTPSLAQTLTGGLATGAGLYGMFGGFGGGGKKEGGLVSLQGGGQPQVPEVGAQQMIPMVMRMYESNPKFKENIDRNIQQMTSQATPVNLGLGGGQVNLGTAGIPIGRKSGGLASFNEGSLISDWTSQLFNQTDSELENQYATLRKDTIEDIRGLPTKEERIEKADRRKMQALYASLIAGGAGVLGADPQKGYAAAVGEGIKTGLPIAAEGMEGYYDALDKADLTEVQNRMQELSIIRDAVQDERAKEQVTKDMFILAKSSGLLGDVTPEFNISEMATYIQNMQGYDSESIEERGGMIAIINEARRMVTDEAHAGGVELNPGQIQNKSMDAIEIIMRRDPKVTPQITGDETGDLNAAIAGTEGRETAKKTDNEFNNPPIVTQEELTLDDKIKDLTEQLANPALRGHPMMLDEIQRKLDNLQEEKEKLKKARETSKERDLRLDQEEKERQSRLSVEQRLYPRRG